MSQTLLPPSGLSVCTTGHFQSGGIFPVKRCSCMHPAPEGCGRAVPVLPWTLPRGMYNRPGECLLLPRPAPPASQTASTGRYSGRMRSARCSRLLRSFRRVPAARCMWDDSRRAQQAFPDSGPAVCGNSVFAAQQTWC